jgi:malonyl-ACP decarboxylase
MAPKILVNLLICFLSNVVPDQVNAPVVSGIGVATSAGYGKSSFLNVLLNSSNVFGYLRRPGRISKTQTMPFIGAELPDPPQILSPRLSRQTGLTGQVAIAVIDEAWQEAQLDLIDPNRIGLVVGGSNLQSREHMLLLQSYIDRPHLLNPRYSYTFFDNDLCGLCSNTYPIRGFSYSLGGASASSAIAILHAIEAVSSGRVDACIALGALQDITYLECQAFQSLGAMGASDLKPDQACRPFDQDHSGFIYGESCAAIVVCRSDLKSLKNNYGSLIGGAHISNGNRGPQPSLEGEIRAIKMALAQAKLTASEIDYVNTHGTGTPSGDDIELKALHILGLEHAAINSTKSIIGHGLSSAASVELAATLLQMREGYLHPTRNLINPIDTNFNWVLGSSKPHRFMHALSLSSGFGGVDTALIVRAP